MFRKLLVANRGEIAARVLRAGRELGIPTAAIASEADRDAFHARLADEVHVCGPAPARESYLAAERIVGVAESIGADAIHPGYGFLAENGAFADLCQARGIRFVGPTGDVIRAMGSKLGSRRIMARAGVSVVPGSEAVADAGEALEAARALGGFPVIVKASAGGGGRGMRIVREESKLADALERGRGEALRAFGDGTLYLEKLVDGPRHVEVQVLADSHGHVVHCFERECSIQRRHQKLIEEAPARIDASMRERLGAAAVAAARAVGYEGAGTVEFLLDASGHFYFLEMNTRIQVEHPVTEAITGLDLVKAQLRIAAGEPLSLAQEDLAMRGHAIEVRIYAEDPDRNFLPSPGRIERWRPPGGFGVRIDAGVEAGDAVTTHYDPLLAKLTAWGNDRPEAIERLRAALDEFALEGVRSTLTFHRRVVRHPVFQEGRYDTGFIDQHLKGESKPSGAQRGEAERRSDESKPSGAQRGEAERRSDESG
ncbi:MAG TPA: acetyl-CoA carboxylase biotin carboxylase subunit [Myxococcota bacterium]|nr:acetyl-CoA carboxylase biotin carboxylase subunit [Myxococcota bacterium]